MGSVRTQRFSGQDRVDEVLTLTFSDPLSIPDQTLPVHLQTMLRLLGHSYGRSVQVHTCIKVPR
jgi:hypothetical protein